MYEVHVQSDYSIAENFYAMSFQARFDMVPVCIDCEIDVQSTQLHSVLRTIMVPVKAVLGPLILCFDAKSKRELQNYITIPIIFTSYLYVQFRSFHNVLSIISNYPIFSDIVYTTMAQFNDLPIEILDVIVELLAHKPRLVEIHLKDGILY
jgi:hypothetical protein